MDFEANSVKSEVLDKRVDLEVTYVYVEYPV